MDVARLLEKLIAQNDIIIRQNEQLLLLIAQRASTADTELLIELKKLNSRLSHGTSPDGQPETC